MTNVAANTQTTEANNQLSLSWNERRCIVISVFPPNRLLKIEKKKTKTINKIIVKMIKNAIAPTNSIMLFKKNTVARFVTAATNTPSKIIINNRTKNLIIILFKVNRQNNRKEPND